MKVDFPKNSYIKKIEVNDDHLDVQFEKKKKVALLFISLNPNYWPYLTQVIEDSRANFLPQHKVDYFVWSDIPKTDSDIYKNVIDCLPTQAQNDESVRLGNGMRNFSKEIISETVKKFWAFKDLTMVETEGIEWPAPTLMRYHLFLQKEEELKDYDYVFYLDADMRVLDKISDEILSDGLLAAEHPMYALAPRYIPPYEPNEQSTAYIKRPGRVVTDEHGKPRFKPYYIAGGFQGGKSDAFIKAMQTMKKNIDIDFDKLNYTAIWNDESHWNKYVFDMYDGPLTVLGPEYIYPDSLIKEYYEPIWGRSLKPKIVTLTKPFSLSKQGADHLNEMLGNGKTEPSVVCPECKDSFNVPGHTVKRIIKCPGSGKAHELDLIKI